MRLKFIISIYLITVLEQKLALPICGRLDDLNIMTCQEILPPSACQYYQTFSVHGICVPPDNIADMLAGALATENVSVPASPLLQDITMWLQVIASLLPHVKRLNRGHTAKRA
jgi:hypothetical protein